MIEMKKKITNIIQTSAPILNRISVESGSEGILFANQLAIIWFDRSNPSFFFPLSPPLPSSYTAEEKKVGSRLKVGAMETRHVSIKQSFDSITRPATHECRCLRQDLGRTWKKIRVSNRDLVELW